MDRRRILKPYKVNVAAVFAVMLLTSCYHKPTSSQCHSVCSLFISQVKKKESSLINVDVNIQLISTSPGILKIYVGKVGKVLVFCWQLYL
jgi:hypothetical protein